jgi:putative MATE family efflux protein
MPSERKTPKILSIWKEEVDLTSGNLFKKMLLFTLPVILSSLLQLVYSSADLLVVDYFGGGEFSMAAVGDNGSLISLIVNTFIGISVGANVVVASAKGAKDKEKASKALHSSIIISLVLGVFVACFGYRLAPSFLAAMHTPAEIIDLASVYLRIYFLGVPFILVFNFGSAILRAMGDSRRPLYALIACGILNVGLNLLFVIIFKKDVWGVAVATVISEALEAFLTILFLIHHKKGFVSMTKKDLHYDDEVGGEVLRHGVPAGLESLIFSISNVVIQAQANTFNAFAVSGNTASDNIEGYIFVVLEAFAVAVSSIVSQNYGANNKQNLRKSLLYSFLTITVLGISLGGLAALLRYQLIGIFIHGSGEGMEEATRVGTQRLILMGLTYWICAMMDIFSAYLRGIKHPIAPTIVTIVCACAMRFIWVYCFFNRIPGMHTLLWLYAVYPITWTIADLTYLTIIPRFTKQAYAEIDARLALAARSTQKTLTQPSSK